MDGARERKEGLSERRKEGAGREGATERIEEQGRSEGSEQGRQGYFRGGLGIIIIIIIIIIRQPLCPVVGRRPQHAVSKLPCLVLSSEK